MEEVNGDKRTGSGSHKNGSHAPWYNVPKQPIVSVEHPFIIKDIDKGLATLGSPSKLEEVSRFQFNRHPHLMPVSWSKNKVLPPVCI